MIFIEVLINIEKILGSIVIQNGKQPVTLSMLIRVMIVNIKNKEKSDQIHVPF